MRNPSDYMLTCIGEEAGELNQVVGKIDRFGLFDVKPSTGEKNSDRFREEFHDIVATYMEYCDLSDIIFDIDDVLIKAKLKRVYTYKMVSYLNDRCTIDSDLYRIVECVFVDDPKRDDYLDMIRGPLTLQKVEHLYGAICELDNPPYKFLPALEKLMTCMN